jgi:putative heme iron utilization protein
MKIPLEAVMQLLHGNSQASLATMSLALPGYPFASALPFAVDETHCPLFQISRLAEHTRNLHANARASLLIQAIDHPQPEAGPRLTLIGEARPVEVSAALYQRFLRYQPGAERYRHLGDFEFFRFEPRRIRLIAGFGQMGWVEAQEWSEVSVLPLEVENSLLLETIAERGVIGIDCYGVDLDEQGVRRRIGFARAVSPQQLPAMLSDLKLREGLTGP